jgi:aromatic ring-opening dioxygenase LigB subunit
MAEPEETPRVEFYTRYEKEADKFDRDLVKKLDDDLATTLIFVSSAFLNKASNTEQSSRQVYSQR